MKTFSIITEADARLLDRGSTVTLAPGGHVTPLALDTLRERKVTVLSAVPGVDLATLAPPMPVRRVALGGDHTSLALKSLLLAHLRQQGLAVVDVGTHTTDAVDYPDVAAQVARLVVRREADAGVVIDGAGLGSAMAANKIDGVRAACCLTPTLARYAREHNGANVLTLGSTLVTTDEALDLVRIFLTTPTTEARYLRRLQKLHALEQTQ
jgi:ribose 5-phosphate isomerase B